MEQNTALLVMDVQNGILGMLPDTTVFLSNIAKAIAIARTRKIPVIYVRLGFRQGAPEISMHNKRLAASKERFAGLNMDEFIKIDDAVAPVDGEIIVTKRRVSAFMGSDLEVVLRAKGIQRMILTGIATSGVVLSTIREASDKDYQITVLSDACADNDEEVHRVLTTKIFPRQADVFTVEEWSNI